MNEKKGLLNCLEITAAESRKYKDGTSLFLILLRIPKACSREIITLDKIRGREKEAKKRINEIIEGGL